ncbi:hypothetical protein C8R45DRAFT_931609 [Mycena sanguinolenta]|nr:hypothetical protein C8R45DRAFT_931609 [Mycena sanguinolenta]
MLFSMKFLSSAMVLLPLVVGDMQAIQTRGTVSHELVVLARNTDAQAAADTTLERRFTLVFELADPVIMINPTDANFGVSAVAPGRFVTSADGTQIFAEARGDPSKPAVRYDTRGHGRSDKPTTAAAWVSQRLAEDFDAVVQSYTLIKPFVLACCAIYGCPIQRHHTTAQALVPGLLQTTNVTQFQVGYIDFINLCHPSLDWDFYLACLGDGVVQPRAATELIVARAQNSTGLLQAGTTEGLPLLTIFGGADQLIIKQAVLDALAGWQNLTVVTLPGAQHFTWISRPVLFRAAVLNWINQIV